MKGEWFEVDKTCEMCGAAIVCADRRRKYCDDCRKARKRLFDTAAMQALRSRARRQRLAEQEELDGLRTENEILREEIIQLKAALRRIVKNAGN